MVSYALARLVAAFQLIVSSQAQSGTFSFLSYNVAGLPDIINDNGVPGDKDVNARTIGTHLAATGYDIVHLQEDFNYHAYIYETDTHAYRSATSGGVPFGSGLNTVANFPWTAFERQEWEDCDISEGDCLTPKGFTFMRMPLGDMEVDLYNLHADAGSEDGDFDARAAGIDQMLAHISANSGGRAVVLGGDFNDRWTNEGLSINRLTDAGFVDPWVSLIRAGEYPATGAANACDVPAANNECEIVDKIFFRSGDGVSLEATSFDYVPDVFVQPDGSILSDHNPILVEFAWSVV